MFSCNDLPMNVGDLSDGFYRRLIIIHFAHPISGDKLDPNFLEQLRAEADGIFLFAFEGLRRLIRNNLNLTKQRPTERCYNNTAQLLIPCCPSSTKIAGRIHLTRLDPRNCGTPSSHTAKNTDSVIAAKRPSSHTLWSCAPISKRSVTPEVKSASSSALRRTPPKDSHTCLTPMRSKASVGVRGVRIHSYPSERPTFPHAMVSVFSDTLTHYDLFYHTYRKK